MLPRPLEETLSDTPFKLYRLTTKPPPSATHEARKRWWQIVGEKLAELSPVAAEREAVKEAGLLKMRVRVLEAEGSEAFLRAEPPINLRKAYAERPMKVRVHVYDARGLAPRPSGALPQPFLKVYNAPGRVRTTRDTATPPSVDPEFYASFEVSALLPGESRLHIEVWDYQLLQENLLGATVVDLEDRLFSPSWQKLQTDELLPREVRPLRNPGNDNSQGFLTVKVEILDRKWALANPMLPVEPPTYDMFELRVIVWDAVDVKAKDESFFGGGGTSDVFVSCQVIGGQPYQQQRTDTHHRSPGDAEFNWRMTWPLALPEKDPRLFLLLWDADILSADDAIGEAQLTLAPLCERALRHGGAHRMENVLVSTTHPNFTGTQGTVRLTLELLPRGEALQKPAGLGRAAPNQHPFLPEPVRPSLFDGLGIDLAMFNPLIFFRRYALCCCIAALIGAVVFVIIFAQNL